MTVTINGSGTMTGLAVGGLNDNIITKNEMATGGAWAPAGTVLQVVQAGNNGVSTTSTSFVDTGLSASITPTSATSKILVICNGVSRASSTSRVGLAIVRNSTQLVGLQETNSSGGSFQAPYALTYLDSPATTSTTTYKLQICSNNGASAVGNNDVGSSYSGYINYITLMEIAA